MVLTTGRRSALFGLPSNSSPRTRATASLSTQPHVCISPPDSDQCTTSSVTSIIALASCLFRGTPLPCCRFDGDCWSCEDESEPDSTKVDFLFCGGKREIKESLQDVHGDKTEWRGESSPARRWRTIQGFASAWETCLFFSTGIPRTRHMSGGSLYMVLKSKSLLQIIPRTRELRDGDLYMALKLGLCTKIPH